MKKLILITLLWILLFIGFNRQLLEDNLTALFYYPGPAMTIDLTVFSDEMNEGEVLSVMSDVPLACVNDHSVPELGNRVCYSNIRSYIGVRALRIAFFFKEQRLAHIKIDIPWWRHGTMAEQLINDLGQPLGGQEIPVHGVRLVGWRLTNGNIFYNRDRDLNPLMWNTVYWMSHAEAASMGGAFSQAGKPQSENISRLPQKQPF